jgi:hypothetical protein
MGWWIDKVDGKELIVGDGPYDVLTAALQQVAEEYLEEWDRKPTLAELTHALEVVLAAHLERYTADGDTLELEALKAKTKKRRKSQAYQVGDFFAIPLSDGRYAFGRILSDLMEEQMGMLVGIYNSVNTRILTQQELRGLPFMFIPFYSSDEGWATWRWRIIGHLPLAEHEFIYPKFKQGDEHRGWKLVDRNQTRSATNEEVEGLEYCSLWTLQGVEGRIEKHLSELN